MGEGCGTDEDIDERGMVTRGVWSTGCPMDETNVTSTNQRGLWREEFLAMEPLA